MGFLTGAGDIAGGRFLLAGWGGTGGRCVSGLGLPLGTARSCCRASARLNVVARAGFAMVSAPAVDFPRLVLEAGGFPEPEFERLEAGGPLLVV